MTPIRTSLPAARRAVVTPTAAKPPAKAVSPEKAAFAKRAVVSVKPKPVDTIWYRVKRAVADVLCNLPIPSFQNRTLSDHTPPGLKQDLKLGDVLLRRTEGTSGNLFIPSWWKHAAVYVGNGKIVEATFEGVKTTTLEDFFAHGDHVAVVRPKGMNVLERHDIVRYAKQQVGKPYDFDMNFDDDGRLSCTELAYRAVRAGSGKDIVEQNWFGAVVGDSFLTDKFSVVYSSNEAQTPKK
jgi:hypothetical protein